MCGIYCRFGRVRVARCSEAHKCRVSSDSSCIVYDAVARRGPDSVRAEAALFSGFSSTLVGSVLAFSPPFTIQPFVVPLPGHEADAHLISLSFNGELYDRHESHLPHYHRSIKDACSGGSSEPLTSSGSLSSTSDTAVVASAIAAAVRPTDGAACPAAFARWLSEREGEFAITAVIDQPGVSLLDTHSGAATMSRETHSATGTFPPSSAFAHSGTPDGSLCPADGDATCPVAAACIERGLRVSLRTDGQPTTAHPVDHTTTTRPPLESPTSTPQQEIWIARDPMGRRSLVWRWGCYASDARSPRIPSPTSSRTLPDWIEVASVGMPCECAASTALDADSAADRNGDREGRCEAGQRAVFDAPPADANASPPTPSPRDGQIFRPPGCGGCGWHDVPPVGVIVISRNTFGDALSGGGFVTVYPYVPIDGRSLRGCDAPHLTPNGHTVSLSSLARGPSHLPAALPPRGGVLWSETALRVAIRSAVERVGMVRCGVNADVDALHSPSPSALAADVCSEVPPDDVVQSFGKALVRAVMRRLLYTQHPSFSAPPDERSLSCWRGAAAGAADRGPQRLSPPPQCGFVGSFYSGGVDSSTLCAIAAAVLGLTASTTSTPCSGTGGTDARADLPPLRLLSSSVAAATPSACEAASAAHRVAFGAHDGAMLKGYDGAAFAAAPDRQTTLSSWFDVSSAVCEAPPWQPCGESSSESAGGVVCDVCGASLDAYLRRTPSAPLSPVTCTLTSSWLTPLGVSVPAQRLRGALRVEVREEVLAVAFDGSVADNSRWASHLPLLHNAIAVSVVCGCCLAYGVEHPVAAAPAASSKKKDKKVNKRKKGKREGEAEGLGENRAGARGAEGVNGDCIPGAPSTDTTTQHPVDMEQQPMTSGLDTTDAFRPQGTGVDPPATTTIAPSETTTLVCTASAWSSSAKLYVRHLEASPPARCGSVSPPLADAALSSLRGLPLLETLQQKAPIIATVQSSGPLLDSLMGSGAGGSAEEPSLPPSQHYCNGSCLRSLVLVDVPTPAAAAAAAAVARSMAPNSTVMDASIATPLSLATAALKTITPSIRMVLHGAGADEQMGGYKRHAHAVTRALRVQSCAEGAEGEVPLSISPGVTSGGSLPVGDSASNRSCGGPPRVSDSAMAEACALVDASDRETIEDVLRLWHRNLGRDDRVVGSYGIELRTPFLDEGVVHCIWGGPPGGRHEKRLLRRFARHISLVREAGEPKRAVQFGTRFADKNADAKANALQTLAAGKAFFRRG